jgi:hypothetical protein
MTLVLPAARADVMFPNCEAEGCTEEAIVVIAGDGWGCWRCGVHADRDVPATGALSWTDWQRRPR